MRSAFETLTQSEPFLPFPDSVLPALLALRKTHQTIVESKAYLASQGTSLENIKKRLEVEQGSLNDQLLLSKALEARIQSLSNELETRMEMTPEQIITERLDELRQKKQRYGQETAKLLKSFNKFIDNHLGAMLAAEELGGPVVGDLMDIDTDGLTAGFNSQGKPKKPKGQDVDQRQRRIDQIWGQAQETPSRKNEERNEASAAGREMRHLTEQLLNTLIESGGESSAAYVKIPRESAAARFLVRSKVAQFHPKDATRLRLVDFGRELDD
jgi:hypothetical protein